MIILPKTQENWAETTKIVNMLTAYYGCLGSHAQLISTRFRYIMDLSK